MSQSCRWLHLRCFVRPVRDSIERPLVPLVPLLLLLLSEAIFREGKGCIIGVLIKLARNLLFDEKDRGGIVENCKSWTRKKIGQGFSPGSLRRHVETRILVCRLKLECYFENCWHK